MSKILSSSKLAEARSARAALRRDRLTTTVTDRLFSNRSLAHTEGVDVQHSTQSTPDYQPRLRPWWPEKLFIAKAPYTAGEPNPELLVTLPGNTNGLNIEAYSDYANGLLSAQIQIGPPEDPQSSTPRLPDSWLLGPAIESSASLSQTIDLPDDEKYSGWLTAGVYFLWEPSSPDASFDSIAGVDIGIGPGLSAFTGIEAFLDVTMFFVGNGAILSSHSNSREIASWAVENSDDSPLWRNFAFAESNAQTLMASGPRPSGANQLIVDATLEVFGLFGERFDYLSGSLVITFRSITGATLIAPQFPTPAPVRVEAITLFHTNPPKPLPEPGA